MKVYTYYDDIGHELQQEMIDLWKRSWRNNGFTPIVLNYQSVTEHPLLKNYEDIIQETNVTLTGREISKYGMSCWYRWVAYSLLSDSDTSVYTCDYDVININFSTNHKPITSLHFMDNRCPCLVSGTPSQFAKFCDLVIEMCKTHAHDIKRSFDALPQCRNLHDQDFLICASATIFPGFIPGKKEVYTTNRNNLAMQLSPRCHVVPYTQHNHNTKLIHFSHSRCGTNENRIKYIRETLDHDRSQE